MSESRPSDPVSVWFSPRHDCSQATFDVSFQSLAILNIIGEQFPCSRLCHWCRSSRHHTSGSSISSFLFVLRFLLLFDLPLLLLVHFRNEFVHSETPRCRNTVGATGSTISTWVSPSFLPVTYFRPNIVRVKNRPRDGMPKVIYILSSKIKFTDNQRSSSKYPQVNWICHTYDSYNSFQLCAKILSA